MPGNQNMRTPKWLFSKLNDAFGPFRLDAAASRKNSLCKAFYTEKRSGLIHPWRQATFCNPPFKKTYLWVPKAHDEWSQRQIKSVLILPVGCSQEWWHKHVLDKALVLYPTKRINFNKPNGTPTTRADRDTIIVVFGGWVGHQPFDTR